MGVFQNVAMYLFPFGCNFAIGPSRGPYAWKRHYVLRNHDLVTIVLGLNECSSWLRIVCNQDNLTTARL